MKQELKRCMLHSPIFVGGKNLGDHLDSQKTHGIVIIADHDTRLVMVEWNGERAWFPFDAMVKLAVPKTNVVELPVTKPVSPGVKPTAQVDTPMSHVFAGEGKGKTGR